MAAAAAATAKVLAQSNRRIVHTEALDVVDRIEDTLVLTSAADDDERHLCTTLSPSVRSKPRSRA
jgi:hypothetical protein